MHGQGSTTFRFSLLEQWTLAEMRVMIYLTPNYIQYGCWQKITKYSINSRYRRLLDQQIQHIHHNYTVHERFAELSLSMSKQRRWKQAYWRVLGPGIGHLPVPALCLAVWINSGGLSLTSLSNRLIWIPSNFSEYFQPTLSPPPQPQPTPHSLLFFQPHI